MIIVINLTYVSGLTIVGYPPEYYWILCCLSNDISLFILEYFCTGFSDFFK